MIFFHKISRVLPHSCRQADVTTGHIKLHIYLYVYGITFFAGSAKGSSRKRNTSTFFVLSNINKIYRVWMKAWNKIYLNSGYKYNQCFSVSTFENIRLCSVHRRSKRNISYGSSQSHELHRPFSIYSASLHILLVNILHKMW